MIEARIDWDALYKDFTQGWWVTDFSKGIHKVHYPTVVELAEKYDCAKGTIHDRISWDRHHGIGDWRLHRKSILAKRKEEATTEGGRFGFYVTESAKLDAIALDTLEQILTLTRLETNLIKRQRDEDLRQLEIDPTHLKNIKFQSMTLQINARTIGSVIDSSRKIIGEPVTGIASEQEQNKVASTTSKENRAKEIDKLLARREKLAKRREKLAAQEQEGAS